MHQIEGFVFFQLSFCSVDNRINSTQKGLTFGSCLHASVPTEAIFFGGFLAPTTGAIGGTDLGDFPAADLTGSRARASKPGCSRRGRCDEVASWWTT